MSNSPLRLVLEFEELGADGMRGSVTPPGDRPIPFNGWMQLSSVLAQAIALRRKDQGWNPVAPRRATIDDP